MPQYAPTPLVPYPAEVEGNRVWLKRDDLLPFSFGGNKVRIVEEYMKDLRATGKTAMIGYGDAKSNLARVLAARCAAENIPCTIVCPQSGAPTVAEPQSQPFNTKMTALAGAALRPCPKGGEAEAVAAALAELRRAGHDPYYIYGSVHGTGNEAVPTRAYAQLGGELATRQQALGLRFDAIFLPTGTGATQAGLLCAALPGGTANTVPLVIGISVARPAAAAAASVRRHAMAWCAENNHPLPEDARIIVDDSWLCGGYGLCDAPLLDTIARVYRAAGLPLDATYTGKAWHGMCGHLRARGVTGKNILFIHTGGAPGFFDMLAQGNRGGACP